ncbi:MAG: hypothetical protein HY822_17335 [Acidobacteria bacterium]|nr:hypothetical protein [Acidobacteriota bacterium]
MRFTRRTFLGGAALAAAEAPLKVRQVDIYHHSHTDVGFTDLPSVCRDMQVRFLDAALDACLANRGFRWTCEVTLTVDDWWRASSAARRAALLRVVGSGQMDVMALAFNQAPYMNAAQWERMLDWLPADLLEKLNPRAAMQNDVNGFPRAGALRLLDRDIRHLLMGINADSGGPPFRRPSAFWWKMPDGRRMFVWLGEHYGTAYAWFEPKNWIRQQPRGAATEFRPPRAGDFHRTDEASLRAAHQHFLGRLRKLEAEGYDCDRLILAYTNQWRYDNDPPFPPLAPFIDAWNKLGLEPRLRLTTATQAVADMERAVGARAPVQEGEWTDWWCNGNQSGPREVSASRFAKRYLAAALSPVWGPLPATEKPVVESAYRDLCLFDEHTWGANISISRPDDLQTIGQYTEKSALAYRPMGHAESLLGRRARAKFDPLPGGLYVANPAKAPYSGWVEFDARALRDDFVSVLDSKSGAKMALVQSPNNRVRFWMNELAPGLFAALRLSKEEVEDRSESFKVVIERDPKGWPVAMDPLFKGELGGFLAAETFPPAGREAVRKKAFRITSATYGAIRTEETPHTLVCTQPFDHPRLKNAERRLELWKHAPRARLTVRFHRLSLNAPEVFYLAFGFPAAGVLPEFSNGGVPFTPYSDQLPGSCRDYYAIDGWARYRTPAGDCLWVTRDAPLVAVGGPHTLARRTTAPQDSHRLLAQVFDNFWHTNFVADSHGEMSFQFDLAWQPQIQNPGALADALATDPVVLLNP